ncbi:hypothetical protein QYQ99_27135 [Comamonas testosteroni]|uniref:hypothetical protein n=1 Tax=Comamonas testosteroni TaxID=285 RepID=UPI00265ECA14|nr:hypothetical protein [Comamonas testosteroni]WKL15940.1 hypothetical protein QYQ99_27135 [Comamonas testosteroni]
MALYIIKHLKAPWPKGAQVGDIIEFDELPGWAAGKCELGGSQPTVFADQEVSDEGSGEALAPADPEAAKIAAALAAADEQARRELNARVLAAEQALAVAKSDLEASLAREATLQGHLTDTQKLNEAAAGELEKVRAQVDDLRAQLTAAKSETKAAKK